MSTDLKRIGEKARKKRKLVFTSLYHHVTDMDNLRACYDALPKDRAVGIDGVTKETYGKELEENLQDLSRRLRRMGYRPKPKRRIRIPKPGSSKGRLLGISCFEDKIVELAVKRVLEPIYETVFLDCSYGYRPGRSQHECLDELGKTIQQKRINHVVEADVERFFDEVNHTWLLTFLQHRIKDPRIIRLIDRMLKSGIMENGLEEATERGTAQGSILSPLLSNLYLHYALDLWFDRRFRRRCHGEAHYVRFADDFLACFEHRGDAKAFSLQLTERLKKFELKVAEEKTRCIEFGRFAREDVRRRGKKPEEFTFLGFTHYCGKTRRGYFKVKRRTNRKKLIQSLREFGEFVRRARVVLKKGELLRQAKLRIEGHLNYYAITDNSAQCSRYVYHATCLVFKWINRKSQRKTYTWEGFNQALACMDWPQPKIREVLDPCRRAEAH
jgi:group II intron reverse transcriptase/maturase